MKYFKLILFVFVFIVSKTVLASVTDHDIPLESNLFQETELTKKYNFRPESISPLDVKNESLYQIYRNNGYIHSNLTKLITRDLRDPKNRSEKSAFGKKIEREKDYWDPRLRFTNGMEVEDCFFTCRLEMQNRPFRIKSRNGQIWTREDDENSLFEKWEKIHENKGKSKKEFQIFLKEDVFGPKNFGFPEDKESRKELFLGQPLYFLNRELIENIYDGAKRIMKLSKQGDYLVAFGNTPYFVGHALEKLSSPSKASPHHRNIIKFPFSGAPNRQRQGNFLKVDDLVTQERLDHLNKRLKKDGLSPENNELRKQDTYFIDVIGSGAGIAYTTEEILRNFKKQGLDLPNFHVVSINKINNNNEEDQRNALIAKSNADASGKNMFYFPNVQNTHFTIQAHEVHISGHTALDMLPSEHLRMFPEYNAAYWEDQHDYLLTQEKSTIAKTLLEYFDLHLDFLMEQDKKK